MARPVWMGNFQPKALAAPAAFILTCASGVLPKTSDKPSISNSDCRHHQNGGDVVEAHVRVDPDAHDFTRTV